MGQSTELRDQPLPRAEPPAITGVIEKVWSRCRLIVVRSVFWAYERGSWQYDLIVLAILAFIFFTPRAWFNDRPTLQMTDVRHQQGVTELGQEKEGWYYQVDARLVESYAPLKAEDAVTEILRSRLQKPFIIKSIVALKDKNNVTLGYKVLIAR
jgi:hypothetical protein